MNQYDVYDIKFRIHRKRALTFQKIRSSRIFGLWNLSLAEFLFYPFRASKMEKFEATDFQSFGQFP